MGCDVKEVQFRRGWWGRGWGLCIITFHFKTFAVLLQKSCNNTQKFPRQMHLALYPLLHSPFITILHSYIPTPNPPPHLSFPSFPHLILHYTSPSLLKINKSLCATRSVVIEFAPNDGFATPSHGASCSALFPTESALCH